MKILAFLGHEQHDSFCGKLHDAYVASAKQAGHEVREIRLGDLSFDPILHRGYEVIQPLEPDLIKAQEDIRWCEHLVLTAPTWWALYPALLKGFFDRAFLPGFAFHYHKTDPMWDKLLAGRSARFITTMDAPVWYCRWFNGDPGAKAVVRGVLKFSGFNPVKVTRIGRVRKMTDAEKDQWIQTAASLGAEGR